MYLVGATLLGLNLVHFSCEVVRVFWVYEQEKLEAGCELFSQRAIHITPRIRFFFFFRFVPFSFLSFIFFFFLCFFSPIDLRLSCVCVVINTTCNIYVVVFLGWQAV